MSEIVMPGQSSGQSGARPPAYDPHLLGGGAVVPYIGSWTGEEAEQPQVIRRPEGGIGFADEILLDRDEWDVLWTRSASLIGAGKPLFKRLHPRRQRRAMLRLLCQVCAQPADHTCKGMLWLVPGDDIHDEPGWPEGMATAYPPVCHACAAISVRMCPALRSRYVALEARSRVFGVRGLVFAPVAPFPGLAFVEDYDVVQFGDPALRWTLATQLVRELVDVTTLDLEC